MDILTIDISQTLFEEGSNCVCDALEILVAFLFGGLETAGDMPLDEGHGDCVWTGA